MMTITFYSIVSGGYKTLNLGCDGTTDHGGDYQLRKEITRSTIQKYVSSSSLTDVVYKTTIYDYYDCNTPFLSDADASTIATELLTSPEITVTCAEDSYTNEPAVLETSSATVQTNRQNDTNYYSFTVKIATPSTAW